MIGCKHVTDAQIRRCRLFPVAISRPCLSNQKLCLGANLVGSCCGDLLSQSSCLYRLTFRQRETHKTQTRAVAGTMSGVPSNHIFPLTACIGSIPVL